MWRAVKVGTVCSERLVGHGIVTVKALAFDSHVGTEVGEIIESKHGFHMQG